jgi:hypothetical protein
LIGPQGRRKVDDDQWENPRSVTKLRRHDLPNFDLCRAQREIVLFALSQIYHDGATRCGNSLSGEVQWAAGPWECELAHKTMNYVKLSRLNNITYNYCSE